jgi:adhesin/invasin
MAAMITRLSRGLSVVLAASMLASIVVPAYAGSSPKLESATISSFTDVIGSTYISAGKGEGVGVGALGSVLRDGKEIAKYKVIQVNWGISRVDLYDVTDGYTVRPGDRAPVLTNTSSHSSKSTVWKALAIVAAAALVAVLVKGHSGGGGGAPSTIALTTTKTSSVNADGDVTCDVTITARINTAGGDAVADGTAVTFATTAGTLNHTQTLAVAGAAAAVLSYNSATDPNTATVTVKSAGQTARATVSFTSSIDLVANPTTIQIVGSGGAVTQSTITATCKDILGTPVTSGTAKFFSSFGTITPDSAPIDGSGVATATFTSNQAGKANIMATWSNSQATIPLTVTAGPPFVLTLGSNPSSVSADGNSSAAITATVRDQGFNPVENGTVVKFFVTPDGGGGGNGTIAAQAVTTNGVATAYLFTKDGAGAKSLPGIATVKAQVLVANQPATVPAPATDLETTTTVEFKAPPGPPFLLTVAANPNSVPADGNSLSTITTTVRDQNGTLVQNGTVVSFSVTPAGGGGGNGTITAQAATTNGVATASLVTRDGAGVKSLPGTATVKAQVLRANQPATVPAPATDLEMTTTVQFTPVDASAVILSASKTNIRGLDVPGNSTTLTARVTTAGGGPVPDGTDVAFTTTVGNLSSGHASTSGGNAVVTLTSSASGGDGNVTVTATAGGITSAPLAIVFSGGPFAASCSYAADPTPAVLAKSGDSATITITAKDVNGHPLVSGTSIAAVTNKGTVVPASAQTNDEGVALFTLSTSSDAGNPTAPGAGTVTVTIPAGGAGSNVVIQVPFTVSP